MYIIIENVNNYDPQDLLIEMFVIIYVWAYQHIKYFL